MSDGSAVICQVQPKKLNKTESNAQMTQYEQTTNYFQTKNATQNTTCQHKSLAEDMTYFPIKENQNYNKSQIHSSRGARH
jgi:hypothetical protein